MSKHAPKQSTGRLFVRASIDVTVRVIGVAVGIAVADHFFHFLGH